MRAGNGTKPKRHEYGCCTVFVRPSATGVLDGLIRCRFFCEVHPAGGGPVQQFDVMEFYEWRAASRALELYKQSAQV